MNDIRQILLCHARRYPAMQPIDAIKLLYQREFGGGHLIKDAKKSLDRLKEEFNTISKTDALYIESIGDSMCRVYLGGADETLLPLINEMFVLGANVKRGRRDQFAAALRELSALAAEGAMPFASPALEAVLDDYRAAGYPMVSHSDIYRESYHPAYRVMPEKYSLRLVSDALADTIRL